MNRAYELGDLYGGSKPEPQRFKPKPWRSVSHYSIKEPLNEYVLHYQGAALKLAAQPDIDLTAIRVYLLAIGRMNNDGHAVFGSGELRRLLGKVDKATGEVKPISRQSVYNAKRKLAEHKAIAENSGGETCVWISTTHAMRKRKSAKCPVHWE